MITRRKFLKWGVSAGMAAAWMPQGAAADALNLPVLGTVKPVSPSAIEASPLSVGMETLDRALFDPERTYPHLAALGVKWARCQTGWCRCETKPGQFDFGWLDAVVDSLLKLGIQPWFNLGYGNKLYTPEATDESAVGRVPIFEEKAKAAWVRFTRQIAERFRSRVRHWEIWNEPNITGFWKPGKPDPAAYVDLVKLTAPEIRRQVPGAIIIGGAFAGMPKEYLKGCLDAGMADHVDRISFHPYRPIPEVRYESHVQGFRELIGEYNKDVKLWQGENGCPSKGGPDSTGALSSLEWDETRQAKWLVRRILMDLFLGIELTSYFHLVDLIGYRKTNYKGLLRGTDYSPKPAFHAYQCLCALFDSRTTRNPEPELRPVGEREEGLYTAGFVRSGRGMYAYWMAANLQKGWTPQRITMEIATPGAATLRQPVLIDPLTGQVHGLEAVRKRADTIVLEDLPLMDYALIVADASVAMPT